MTSFSLKIIAIVGMTASHTALIFDDFLPFTVRCILLALGGVTFPIMAFLVSEGYRHTSNIQRYIGRLLLFALIAQIPYQLFLAPEGNVLFTLLIGLLILHLHDRIASRMVFWLAFVAGCLVSALCDWGIVGPVMILMCHLLDDRRERAFYPVLLPMIGIGGGQALELLAGKTPAVETLPVLLYAIAGCGVAAMLLYRYDGRHGRPLKLFFYVYYPAHLLILGILRGVAFGIWPGF